MAEEKIVKINIQKELLKVPRWERRGKIFAILRRRLKNSELKIDQDLNEKIFTEKIYKLRLKLVKNDKNVTAKLVE